MTDTPKKSRKGIGGRPKGRSYTEKIQIKLTPAEREMLSILCDYHGDDASGLVRMWMYDANAKMEKEKSD